MRRGPILQRCQNISEICFRAQRNRRVGKPQTFGTHAHLLDRFFTGNVDSSGAGSGKHGGCLQKQGRFANPRITTNKNGGTSHQTTPQYAVKLCHACCASGVFLGFACKRDKADLPSLGPGRL